ncbi:HAD-IC family P-type ATPase [Methylosinus sp. Ce-a6]|uniref:HAD-IC family P-type ATPase n=1 Tax=Methylosinus sp. Ce-a6 TaxID=2172005 RepID=UPI00135C46D7|nr:HAD-IC family P-type ATPase [Methylosinus sp. Ce-a6]
MSAHVNPTLSLARAEIVHRAVPGRVRIRHFGLAGRDSRVEAVMKALLARPGVASARASALTATVLVEFSAPASIREILQAVEDAVAEPQLDAARAPFAWPLSAAVAADESVDLQWHAMTAGDAARRLATSAEAGLDPQEATRRLAVHGRNEIPRVKPRSPLAIFGDQMVSLPVFLLVGSAALSLMTGGIVDAAVIGAVVLLNASIATATEHRAERTIRSLSDYSPHRVSALRGGARVLLDPAEIVRGDILSLERGMLIPADARLIFCDDFSVNESALTGEAVPVQKTAEWVLRADTGLPERRNMLYRGTAVTGGSATALVTATGATTEIGRVQRLLGSLQPPETPMQRQLDEVERELIFINALVCGVVFGIGLARRHAFVPMLRNAISLIVAAIPEGLPAVATTTLALGVENMRRRDVLVRKLDAVETLGAVEVIGLDKTGTLTENRMETVAIHADGLLLAFEGGRLVDGDDDAAPTAAAVTKRLLEVAALCSDAVLRPEGEGCRIDGTPTESALLEAALAFGVDVAALRREAPLVAGAPRSENRKRMSTLHERDDGARLLCVKGDPGEVLLRCASWATKGGVAPLDDPSRAKIREANGRMAARALRVLGVAICETGGDPRDERDLVWLGLAGLINPIRPSVRPALQQLHRAGIRSVMITGDQSATALAIARKLDLGDGGDIRVLEAGEIAALSPDMLAALTGQAQVFARVSPVDKLKIVKALQNGGRVVGMTGDGVNDGPALRAANISIAMGGEGTDVAREVADMVLVSDDLGGVVEAVRLGRATHSNIRKVLRYLISTSVSETFVMLGAALLDGGVAMTSTQLLWLNIAGEPLPALALGLEEPEDGLLEQPPHDPRAPILTPADFRYLLLEGAVIGVGTLAAYHLAGGARSFARAGTITFHGLTLGQLFHAVNCRSERAGLAGKLARSPNRKLAGAVVLSTVAQAAAQLFPATRRVLGLAPIGGRELLGIAGVAIGAAAANDAIRNLLPTEPRRAAAPES